MELSGSEIIIQFLKDEGVKHLFGYPGGAVLHIYDALHKQNDVEHILVRHEQGATHAADGYARATGKPGVCLVTSGERADRARHPHENPIGCRVRKVCRRERTGRYRYSGTGGDSACRRTGDTGPWTLGM